MVQICAGCCEKHSSQAEGGPPVPATSESGATQSLESSSAMYSASGAIAGNHVTAFVGRNSPSEKSLANSDSTSNVRFKVSQTRAIEISIPLRLYPTKNYFSGFPIAASSSWVCLKQNKSFCTSITICASSIRFSSFIFPI